MSIPDLDEVDTGRFWQAASEHRLVFQRCVDCSCVVFYPRSHCTSCTSTSLQWEDSAGHGSVYAGSVVRRTFDPIFAPLTPYTVAWIDLDEGFRMLSHIVDATGAPSTARVGDRVRLHWITRAGAELPAFEVTP